MKRFRVLKLWLVLLAPMSACQLGCDKDDTIQRYQVAKTPDAPLAPDGATTPDPHAAGGMPGDMQVPPASPADASATPPPIHWTLPAGWTQLPRNQIRYASIAVSPAHPELQLSIVPLGGTGGTLLSNINRWEGQIGLPPSSEDDLKTSVTRIDVGGTPVEMFDRTGAQPPDQSVPKRIVAAIATHEDRTWFVKLAGPADQIQEQIANFQAFVQSIRFDSGAPSSPDASPAINSPTVNSASPNPTAANTVPTLPISFTIPTGWQQEPAQPNSFRVVAFRIINRTDTGETIVTRLAAGSGSMIENINRWRGQVGLDPINDPGDVKSTQLAAGNLQATVWDFDNPATSHRMVVAMITRGGQWWFFKLAGSSALVAAQRSAFDQFVSSLQFRDDPKG
jgi:hypothetical protein